MIIEKERTITIITMTTVMYCSDSHIKKVVMTFGNVNKVITVTAMVVNQT